MRIMIDTRHFAEAFHATAAAAPSKSPKPVLMNVLLRADGENGSVLMGTDLEVGIRRQILGLKVDAPGSAILPSKEVGQILRVSSDPEMMVEVDDDKLVLCGERSRFVLGTEDPALFPAFPAFPEGGYHVVAAADFKRLVRRTIFATDPESTRYALGGCLVELTADSVAFVATDGRRLARMQVAAEVEGQANPAAIGVQAPVIPAKALKLIERHLEDDDPPVHLAINPGTAAFVRTDKAMIYSRLVEGRFPAYREIFPATCEARIDLEVGPFRNAVERAAIVTNETTRGVDFEFKPGILELLGSAADVGSCRVELPIAHDGKAIEITFDPRYVLDALKVLDDDATIRAELIDAKNAAVLRTDDGQFQYVIMPVTRER